MVDRILNSPLTLALLNIEFTWFIQSIRIILFALFSSVMNNATVTFQYTKPPCILTPRSTDRYVTNQVVIAVYATLIPLIITISLLSINGIIKTKQNRFNSSQILFVSDMTFGALQLPVGVYIFWKKNRITCFELQLNLFSIEFPIIMSFCLLCVISINRYINVVSSTYYKRIVTEKFLPIATGLVIVTSFISATFEALFMVGVDKKEVGKGYIALATYCEALMAINITINEALLTNAKKQTKKSTTRQSIGIRLTKAIAIIVSTFVIVYLPVLVIVNILGYAAMSSTDIKFFQNMATVLYWTLIPTQLNAVLNSAIYLARNRDIKKILLQLI